MQRFPLNDFDNAAISACQIPVVRQSVHLMERVIAHYADGKHWSYCEMTGIMLARHEGFTVQDTKASMPQFFGTKFSWNTFVNHICGCIS